MQWEWGGEGDAIFLVWTQSMEDVGHRLCGYRTELRDSLCYSEGTSRTVPHPSRANRKHEVTLSQVGRNQHSSSWLSGRKKPRKQALGRTFRSRWARLEMALGVKDTVTEQGLGEKEYQGPQWGSSRLGERQMEEDETLGLDELN